MSSYPFIIGVDIGGTFTDVALITRDGKVIMSKASSTPSEPQQGVFDALEGAAKQVGMTLGELLQHTARITHGSTVATNALLTRTGARVGLITTRGFEDTPFVMRGIGRVDGLPEEEVRHAAWVTKPEPLVDRTLVFGVSERIDIRGRVVVPLNQRDVDAALDALAASEVDAVAVCLLNSWANPEHEELIHQRVVERFPEKYCSSSYQLARLAGEYARTNTVLVDSFVGPRVHTYLRRLEENLRGQGFQGTFLLMQGSGGLTSRAQCAPVATLQSGPAGGMLATAHMSKALGHQRVLTADMGGTSFDVGLYIDGFWNYAQEPIFNRFRIMQPIIEIESIGAGGGTIGRADRETTRLLVGPQSAGAEPGPACYGRGGTYPTVTDANVALGLLDPEYFLGGAQSLNTELSMAALVEQVGEPLGLSDLDAAAGIQQIINGKMADLIRRQVIRSGHLPEEFVLYSFGGAAALHAVGFARDLGVKRIYVFPTSPVFSAFGMAVADVLHTRVMTCQIPVPSDPEVLNQPLQEVEADLLGIMGEEGFDPASIVIRRYASVHFQRQTFGVDVELPWDRFTPARMQELMHRFLEKYEELYGSGSGSLDAGVEIGGLRVDAIGPVSKPPLEVQPTTETPARAKGTRRVYYDKAFHETNVYDWDSLLAGQVIPGPAIVESRFTTVWIPADTTGRMDAYSNLMLEL